MRYNQYRFKFYLNASHSIYLNGVLGQEHPHTWEITLNTIKLKDNFIIFNDIEKNIEKYLEKYQDSYLNKVDPFQTLNSTLENICQYFKNEFQNLLLENGWLLLSMEISETPTRSYIIDISDEVDYNKILDYGDAENLNFDILEKNVDDKIESMKKSI
ncbi:6-carboxytetrahydropterin synthase [Clostridium guangxiense]|uniref:6-carboxytetrahydropterin synthase n=1 Tax=Clostridium guangxiense TaxID=1662055 RepID=UPI001E47C69C|nr:6-carboxytetrahydropterin synthase [Clostridium guangxiense]MCD2346180.1 6-carboxytetrahydropterin synthase [Clostridium guangxiense]